MWLENSFPNTQHFQTYPPQCGHSPSFKDHCGIGPYTTEGEMGMRLEMKSKVGSQVSHIRNAQSVGAEMIT